MRKLTAFAFSAILALTLSVAGGLYAQEKPTDAAQKAADQWLALVDAGKYGESWDQAAGVFKTAVTRADWEREVRQARGPLGKVISRKVKKADYMKNPPNAPPGDYVGMQYDTSFQNLKSATETVVPVLDKDGTWRVSGYFVQKAP